MAFRNHILVPDRLQQVVFPVDLPHGPAVYLLAAQTVPVQSSRVAHHQAAVAGEGGAHPVHAEAEEVAGTLRCPRARAVETDPVGEPAPDL